MDRTPSRWERLAPLTGLVFAVVLIATFFISNDSPDTDAKTSKWVDYYSKNDSREIALSIAATIAVVFFVWFAGALRARLRAAEGSPGRLSNTAFGGALLFAVGGLLFIGLNFTAADTVGDVPPQVTQTIGVLDSDLFFPLSAGTALFLLASGVCILRTRALPRWLGWVAAVAGVVALTPVGFFSFLLLIVWVGVLSVLMYLRPEAGTAAPAAPPPPAAPAV